MKLADAVAPVLFSKNSVNVVKYEYDIVHKLTFNTEPDPASKYFRDFLPIKITDELSLKSTERSINDPDPWGFGFNPQLQVT